MIENKNPEINVDELMEQIREEVRRRKERGGSSSGTVYPKAGTNPPPPHMRSDFSKIENIGEPEPFESKADGYHINDFLKYHDQQFVINAYRGILRRRPDSRAHEYFLENLRSGKMTKAEVLGRLRYAPEGRRPKIKIKGLFWNFVIQSSFRIPLLGYVFRLIFGIANLPLIIRNMQILEESTFVLAKQQQNELGRLKAELEPVLDRKSDRDELKSLKAELEPVLDRKSDRDELKSLKAELEPVLDRKSEKEEVELINEKVLDVMEQTRDHKLNILDQQRRLKILLEEARKRLPEPLSSAQIQKMLTEEEHILDAIYVSLEDQERGTRQDIKHRLEFYLPYIQKFGAGTTEYPLIDVGCGRGEWLELLKENGCVASGVDVNRVMQRECEELGLDVSEEDALEFLRKLKNNSVGAVTGFHIVEHLPMRTMLMLFSEALRVLKPGGLVVFETPNPENIFVGSCTFYTDPTHRNPIPPTLLVFLIEYQGFVEPEIVRLNPLNAIVYKEEDGLKDLVYRFNMGQDYAVIARKAL